MEAGEANARVQLAQAQGLSCNLVGYETARKGRWEGRLIPALVGWGCEPATDCMCAIGAP